MRDKSSPSHLADTYYVLGIFFKVHTIQLSCIKNSICISDGCVLDKQDLNNPTLIIDPDIPLLLQDCLHDRGEENCSV